MHSRKVVWPSFFIVGAVKSGTTSLYAHLKRHPQVFLPEVKEPHYFATFRWAPAGSSAGRNRGSYEKYQALYRGADAFSVVGDASPSYLWDEAAPRRIREVSPGARIIMILRDPVARAYSQFLMDAPMIGSKITFADVLEKDFIDWPDGWGLHNPYIELGMYHDQVARYFEIFGREQVQVLFSSDLRDSPHHLLQQIAQHLNIDPAPFDGFDLSERQNKARVPRYSNAYRIATTLCGDLALRKFLPGPVRKWLAVTPLLYSSAIPALDEAIRKNLQQIFEPDVARLERLLERPLPQLRESWR